MVQLQQDKFNNINIMLIMKIENEMNIHIDNDMIIDMPWHLDGGEPRRIVVLLVLLVLLSKRL